MSAVQFALLEKVSKAYTAAGQKLGSALHAPTKRQAQLALFAAGTCLLVGGIAADSFAQIGIDVDLGGGGGGRAAGEIRYNDTRLTRAINAILTYLEGSFGALVMTVSGIGAILSAAFGQYRAALGCLVVAVGAFILRSFMGTFFNDAGVRN